MPRPLSATLIKECSPFRQTLISTTVASASMLLSTRSATALAASYPMSRSDVISLAAEGIKVVLRGILALLLEDKLWSRREAPLRSARLAYGAAFADRVVRAAHKGAVVEERIVELRVRARRT